MDLGQAVQILLTPEAGIVGFLGVLVALYAATKSSNKPSSDTDGRSNTNTNTQTTNVTVQSPEIDYETLSKNIIDAYKARERTLPNGTTPQPAQENIHVHYHFSNETKLQSFDKDSEIQQLREQRDEFADLIAKATKLIRNGKTAEGIALLNAYTDEKLEIETAAKQVASLYKSVSEAEDQDQNTNKQEMIDEERQNQNDLD